MPHVRPLDDPFTCTWRRDGDTARVRPAGEIDCATSPVLANSLREAGYETPVMELDLRAVTFMDSSGMHVIEEAHARAGREGRRLVLIRGPASVDLVLGLIGTPDGLETLDRVA